MDLNKLKELCAKVVQHIEQIQDDKVLPLAKDWEWAEMNHASIPLLHSFLDEHNQLKKYLPSVGNRRT